MLIAFGNEHLKIIFWKYTHNLLANTFFSQNIDITCPIYDVEEDKDRWEEFTTTAVNVVKHLSNTSIILSSITIVSTITIISSINSISNKIDRATSVVWWKRRQLLTRCPTLQSLLIQATDLEITWEKFLMGFHGSVRSPLCFDLQLQNRLQKDLVVVGDGSGQRAQFFL